MAGATGLTGSTGPTGPTGEAGGLQVELRTDAEVTVLPNDPIVFDNVIVRQGGFVTYNTGTGLFTLSRNGCYFVHWWLAIDGASTDENTGFAIVVDGVTHSYSSSPLVTGQICGSALIVVSNSSATFTLTNDSGEDVNFGDIQGKAGLTIYAIAS